MTGRMALIAGLALMALSAAAPSQAARLVRFSFTADGTPVKGVMSLDCPAGGGACSILSLNGTFGDTPISRDNPPPDPPPPPPAPRPPPDNLITRPDYGPTQGGTDFFCNSVCYFRFSADPAEDQRIWDLYLFELPAVEFVREYTVTDYHADVPEPRTWALLLAGFFGLGTTMRRWRKAELSPTRSV